MPFSNGTPPGQLRTNWIGVKWRTWSRQQPTVSATRGYNVHMHIQLSSTNLDESREWLRGPSKAGIPVKARWFPSLIIGIIWQGGLYITFVSHHWCHPAGWPVYYHCFTSFVSSFRMACILPLFHIIGVTQQDGQYITIVSHLVIILPLFYIICVIIQDGQYITIVSHLARYYHCFTSGQYITILFKSGQHITIVSQYITILFKSGQYITIVSHLTSILPFFLNLVSILPLFHIWPVYYHCFTSGQYITNVSHLVSILPSFHIWPVYYQCFTS